MSLDKGLKRLDGVSKTQLTTNKPVHLDITIKPGVWVDPSAFIKQIADAGYAARKDEIRLKLTGKLTRDGERYVFTVDDVKPGPQTFLLVRGVSKNEAEAKAMSTAFGQLADFTGTNVEIEGDWRPADTKKDKTALPTLTLTHVEKTKAVQPP